ncbi:MAG: iron-sulfur cluster insertion protein ErpA [Chloroflexota bacterium]
MTINLDTLETEVETQAITLTSAAAAKVRALLTEKNLPDHGLRIFVSGGGCSGMQYGMALEGKPSEFDTVIEMEGVKLVVDPTSMMYLGGVSVDYVDNLMGGGFRIDNPNAVSTCGCGHSFRTTGSAGASDSSGCGH